MKSPIQIKGLDINLKQINNEEYVSLTDMIKAKDGDFFVSDWLRNRNTIELLGIWEKLHNPNFNYGEYAIITTKAGLNNFKLSVKEWVEKTNSIGLIATSGRYGGTFAHKYIALAFASWISAEFQLYLISEFDRLKEQEFRDIDWNIKRTLTKINYQIHANAVKENLIPKEINNSQITKYVYASEADILNIALFGQTAQEWKEHNKNKIGNMRDYANVSQLVCLSNLENINSVFIKEGLDQSERLMKLNQVARSQMQILTQNKNIKKLEK